MRAIPLCRTWGTVAREARTERRSADGSRWPKPLRGGRRRHHRRADCASLATQISASARPVRRLPSAPSRTGARRHERSRHRRDDSGFLVALAIAAPIWGYDSRDGVESDQPARRVTWLHDRHAVSRSGVDARRAGGRGAADQWPTAWMPPAASTSHRTTHDSPTLCHAALLCIAQPSTLSGEGGVRGFALDLPSRGRSAGQRVASPARHGAVHAGSRTNRTTAGQRRQRGGAGADRPVVVRSRRGRRSKAASCGESAIGAAPASRSAASGRRSGRRCLRRPDRRRAAWPGRRAVPAEAGAGARGRARALAAQVQAHGKSHADAILVGVQGDRSVLEPVDFKWTLETANPRQVGAEVLGELLTEPPALLATRLARGAGRPALPPRSRSTTTASSWRRITPRTAPNWPRSVRSIRPGRCSARSTRRVLPAAARLGRRAGAGAVRRRIPRDRRDQRAVLPAGAGVLGALRRLQSSVFDEALPEVDGPALLAQLVASGA